MQCYPWIFCCRYLPAVRGNGSFLPECIGCLGLCAPSYVFLRSEYQVEASLMLAAKARSGPAGTACHGARRRQFARLALECPEMGIQLHSSLLPSSSTFDHLLLSSSERTPEGRPAVPYGETNQKHCKRTRKKRERCRLHRSLARKAYRCKSRKVGTVLPTGAPRSCAPPASLEDWSLLVFAWNAMMHLLGRCSFTRHSRYR